MPSFFPGGQDSFTSKVDLVDTILASHVNDLQNAVASLEIGGVSKQNIAYAASITPNVPAGEYVIVGALTGNITINAPTNALTGRRLTFRFTQDGTGGRTVTWNAVFKITNWTINTGANAVTEATFTYDGTNWFLASNPVSRVLSVLNLQKDYGAKGDGAYVTDGVTAVGSAVITSASNPWKSSDQGKLLGAQFAGASSATVVGTISAVNGAGSITASFTCQQNLAGAFIFWVSDDTAAITNFYSDCSTLHARGYIPWGFYGYNGAVTITDACQIEGAGCLELWGTIAFGLDAACRPCLPPYFVGSVLWQFAANTDGLAIPVVGKTVNLAGFGIMFAQLYANSGHGVNAVAPNYLGHADTNVVSATWDSVKVFGHDGNHYGHRIANPFNSKFLGLKSYGGGGLDLKGDSSLTQYGNSMFEEGFFHTYVFGTADAIRLEASSDLALNLITMNRVQAWLRTPTVAIPGTTPPAAPQRPLNTDSFVNGVTWMGDDAESNAGSPAVFGTHGITLLGGGFTGGRWFVGGRNAGDVILGLQGRSSGQTGDILSAAIKQGISAKAFFINAKGQLCMGQDGSPIPPVSSALNANISSVTFATDSFDQIGQMVVVVAAGGLAANTKICTVTFHDAFPATFFKPRVRVINETDGAGLAVVNFYVANQSTGVSFELFSNQALVTGTYKVGYIVIGGQ